jgi:anion-transporting  ArsA/GET3 family ATPase
MPDQRVQFDVCTGASQNRQRFPMPAFAPRRFLFITGKGGVGKTTVTAALAKALAARGVRVLVTVCGAKERLSTLLGAAPLTSAIAELGPNLWGVRLVSEVALREYGTLKLKNRMLVDAIFDSKYVSGFLSGTPGLKEWSLLGKAWYHATEEDGDGRPRFDVVLFDAPATGHGLDMLRVPKVIVDIAPPGVLRSDAERAWEMFRDPSRSGVVVVTLPEEMPTNETLELCAALRSELTLPIAELVINSVLPPLFSSDEVSALERLPPLDAGAPAQQALGSAVRRAARQRIQDECVQRLQQLGVPLRSLELLVDGAASPEAVVRLAESFAR